MARKRTRSPVSNRTIGHGAMSVRQVGDGWKTVADVLGIPWDPKGSSGDVLAQAAAVACVDVLARDIGKAPFELRKRLPNGGSEVVAAGKHWLARLFALDPNSVQTWVEFREMAVYHLSFVNNCFMVPRKNRAGEADEIVPVQPARMRPEVVPQSPDGPARLVYRYSRGIALDDVVSGPLPDIILPDDVIHIRSRSLDGLNGIATTRVGRSIFDLTNALEEFQQRIFGKETSRSGVFTTDNEIEEENWKAIKTDLSESFDAFVRFGKPLFLDQGWKYNSVGMTAEQAQVAAAFDTQLEQACRLFNVPPHKIFHTKAVKYENLETIDKSYVADSLVPICNRIERRMERGLLTEQERISGIFIEINREALSLRDDKALTERVVKAVERGIMDLDEARTKLGLNPVFGRRLFLIPSNMQVVDDDAQVVIKAGGTASANAAGDGAVAGDGGDANTNGAKGVLRLVSGTGD